MRLFLSRLGLRFLSRWGLLYWLLCGSARALPTGMLPGGEGGEPVTGAPEAAGDPADALDDASRPWFEQAESERAAKHPIQAAALYRLVLATHPEFVPASLGLGLALVEAGQTRQAVALYRGLGEQPDAVEALARLVEPDAPAEALRLWKKLEGMRLGDPAPHCAQARVRLRPELLAPAPGSGSGGSGSGEGLDAALSAWQTCTLLLEGVEPDPHVFWALVDALQAAGRSEAESLMEGYVDVWPAGAAAAAARARLDRLDVERAALQWVLPADQPLLPEQAARARQGFLSLGEGRAGEAERIGTELIGEAPKSSVAHGLLSEALSAQGRWSDAEIHALIARNLAPDDADARLRLGLLLLHAYGGRRNAEAAEELREAAALRPESAELRYPLGLVEKSLGNWEAAIQSFEVFLRREGAPGAPGGSSGSEQGAETNGEARDARERLESLRRNIPPPPPLPEESGAIPAAAAARYRIALELFRRGRQQDGEAELEAALQAAPDATALINRKARLLLSDGQTEEAIRAWERSLEIDPAQGSIQLLLGELAERRGFPEEAEQRFQIAAANGQGDAWFLLARLSAARGDWDQTGLELAAWRATSGRTSPYQEAAGRLERQVTRRKVLIRGSVGAVIALGLGLPVLVWVRRRTAWTLRDLLDGAPECWHDAARILAGLRHEVLKHNTTVLPDVADALEAGDDRPLLAFAERAPRLLERFEEHLDGLEVLGSRYGFRIDLRHRDPILAPMYRAMQRMSRPARATPAELRAISGAINGAGYAALGRIVQEICVLPITPDLVRATYDRILTEPGIAGTVTPELEVTLDGESLAVRIFRNDLEDILANLLRNALAAGTTRLSVLLTEDDDPITGVGMVEFRITDDAPGTLTNAMIRGRYIGRGLGLAVDIINRHEGSIRVQPVPPDSAPGAPGAPGNADSRKCIIVQLPRVEPAAVEAEWSG